MIGSRAISSRAATRAIRTWCIRGPAWRRAAARSHKIIRPRRSGSWYRSPPAASPTGWRVSWPTSWPPCGSSRSSWRTVLDCRGLPVSRPAKDGYTLMLTSNGHTIARAISEAVPFDPVKDFAGVSIVASAPVWRCARGLPAKTLKEFIDGGAEQSGQAQFRLRRSRQHHLPRRRSHAPASEDRHGPRAVQGRARGGDGGDPR